MTVAYLLNVIAEKSYLRVTDAARMELMPLIPALGDADTEEGGFLRVQDLSG